MRIAVIGVAVMAAVIAAQTDSAPILADDPVPMYRFDDLEQFKRGTIGRVCGSENLGTKVWYAEALQRGERTHAGIS